MNRNPLLTLFFLTALLSQTTFAHPGRLDSSGCHHEKKTGGYHCHNGNSQPPSVPQPQVTEPSSAETPYEVKQGLTCSSYLKEGDSLNDNGQTESAYKNYLEAYKIAKTKEQKKAVLASLAVTSLKREQTGESLQYLQELLTLFPDNKWAIDFVKKNNLDMSVATVYGELLPLVIASTNTIDNYQPFLKKHKFSKEEDIGLKIFSKDFSYWEWDSPSPNDVIMLFFSEEHLMAVYSMVAGLPAENFTRASDRLKSGQLIFLTKDQSINRVIELYIKDWQSTAG